MRTTTQWWHETRDNPDKLERWLRAQYRGEATAAGRIEALRDAYAAVDSRAWRALTRIAADERKHAAWVAELLVARGLPVEIEATPERYWKAPLAAIEDLETGCAVGAHAERMRLARIEEIAADPSAPADIRRVFQRILPDERYHERAFRFLAGADAMAATEGAHRRGASALGLVE